MRSKWVGWLMASLTLVGAGSRPVCAIGDADDELLISGRMEMIYFHNFTDRLRVNATERSRFYFNNIFLNFEGGLGPKAEFIIEFQPLTSDLYLLGGFLTIAEALEGIGVENADDRKELINNRIRSSIRELDEASGKPSFERASVTFYFDERSGISLGRMRNPFGFWDDYSAFRNLSALKTDPISLGVSLRRAGQGMILFSDRRSFELKAGVLLGVNTLANKDENNAKDLVFRIGHRGRSLDLAANVYYHDFGPELNTAYGLSYRYRATYNLTLLANSSRSATTGSRSRRAGSTYRGITTSVAGPRACAGTCSSRPTTPTCSTSTSSRRPPIRLKGTYLQSAGGLAYAFDRSIDLGAKLLFGADEEGDSFVKAAVKVDAKF